MGITNLGAVSMSAGGVYNPETVYKKYKVVSANGGSYMYIHPTPAAGVSLTDTSHWQQIAEKGDTGETGPQGPQGPQGEAGDTGETGEAGASVQTALINESGNLIISLTNGATQNAGSVWVGGIANYSRGLTDQYNNNITTDDLLVDESGTHLPIVRKAQADKNGNDIDTTYQKNPLTFSDISAAAWVADTTYTGFGYACTLSLTGVTADMYATVIFGVDDAVSGNYAPVCLTGAGTVKVYAKVSTSITIPTIRAEV